MEQILEKRKEKTDPVWFQHITAWNGDPIVVLICVIIANYQGFQSQKVYDYACPQAEIMK